MEAINLLRRLHKFRKTFFNTNFDAHFKYIASNYLNSPRTCIVKISLMLLGEIFSEVISHAKFADWIEFLVPVILKKNVLGKNMIDEEAKNVLTIFCKNIHCTEGLTIFLKYIQDKNLRYSSKSYELFLDIIEEIDTEKLQTDIKWEPVLKEIIKISENRPDKCEGVFTILLKKLGNDFMEKMLNDMLNLEDYLYFSKTEMTVFNNHALSLIQAEKEPSTITLKEHIKSMKHSEKLEYDLIPAQEEDEAKDSKEVITSSKKMPELVIYSAKKTEEKEKSVVNSKAKSEIVDDIVEKSASGSKTIENGCSSDVVNESSKRSIVIAENPLKNCSSKKNEENNSPAMSKKMDVIDNEERPKGSVEVDPLRSSVAKLKDQENAIN